MSALSSLPRPEPDRSGTASPGGQQRHGRPTLSVAGPAPSPVAPEHPTPGERPTAPSLPALRVRLVPRSEPPAVPLRASGPAHRRPPVLGSPDALARPRPLAGPADGDTGDTGPVGPLPDPTPTCCAVVQAAVEGLRGARPLAQLTRWVTPEVYERLALRAGLVQGAGAAPVAGRAGVRRVRVFRLGDHVAEATVVVDDGPRVRAVAVRVEEHRGRWRATALEIG